MWLQSLALESWKIVTELAPWLFVGAGIAGLLHLLVSDAWLERILRGRWGVVRAVLFGIPMPLCSCGVIPAGVSLKQRGASDSAAIAFMISTPQTGVDSILVSASFLGWPFALFKVFSAALLGLLGGLFTPSGPGLEEVIPGEALVTPKRSAKDALQHAVEVIRSIWAWLLFGVLASAALSTLVPTATLSALVSSSGALAIVAVLALSVPLYVCATASVPIAAALVAGGFPPGAALVFLMAGPATNLATIGAVYRTFGGRTLAIYLGTIILGSTALGLGFDSLLMQTLPVHSHQHHAAWWQVLSGVLLVAMMVGFALESLRTHPKLNKKDASLVELGVEGMTCQGCVRKLEKRLRVESAGHVSASFQVELEGGRVRAQGLTIEELRRAVEDAGFREQARAH